jgi:hypothetical protein
LSISDGAEARNNEIALREDRRLDAAENGGHLRPRISVRLREALLDRRPSRCNEQAAASKNEALKKTSTSCHLSGQTA